MKTLNDINFYDKTTLVRTDINSDIVNKKVLLSERINQASKTISELKRRGAKVVVIAHQGRPGKSDCTSLKKHSKYLNKHVKIKFINDLLGKKAKSEIKNLKKGDAILLENLRFEKHEFKPEKGKNNKLIKNLAPLFDIYINDAFSVSHRKHTSIISFPKYLKHCAGRLLEKEIKALKKLKKINKENTLFILGGAKPEDNIKLIKGQKILSCGLFGQTCLSSKKFKLGTQDKYLKKEIKNFNKIKNNLKKKKNIQTPLDFAVKIKNKRKELSLEEFPSKYEIFDIGSKTIKKYTQEIKKAKVIFMKGPAGFCGDKKFCKGTNTLLKAIAKNKGFTVLGGGHLSDALKKAKINHKKFSHVSLSGGALLRYLAGEKLPGLKVLEK